MHLKKPPTRRDKTAFGFPAFSDKKEVLRLTAGDMSRFPAEFKRRKDPAGSQIRHLAQRPLDVHSTAHFNRKQADPGLSAEAQGFTGKSPKCCTPMRSMPEFVARISSRRHHVAPCKSVIRCFCMGQKPAEPPETLACNISAIFPYFKAHPREFPQRGNAG